MTATRRTIAHLAILMLGGALAYFVGLTDHGLTNTQESLRLTAAREMQARGEWIVPTRLGEPYISKPPVMYWTMIGIAQLRGTEVGLFELRATVALGGLLGMLATYFAGRVLMRDPDRPEEGPAVAFWGALGLMAGVLFTRSSRIGELDILLVPTVTIGVAAIAMAWRRGVEQRRTWWPGIALASVCCAVAALTKGPVPIAVIAAAGYGSILVSAAIEPGPGSGRWRWVGRLAGLIAAGAVWVESSRRVEGASDWLGVLIFMAVAGMVAMGLVRLVEPARVKRWLAGLGRTHPWLVLGSGAASLWWWLGAVEARIGTQTIGRLKDDEVRENLNLLMPQSPVRNLGFMAYGVGAASVAAIIALVWIIRERPVLTRGRLVVLVWMLLGFVIFSTMGKGVARYLTPLWPAVALLGGWWFVRVTSRIAPRRPRGVHPWRITGGVILVGMIAGQTWWYADGRDRFVSERSPRDFVRTLLDEDQADPRRVGSFGFEAPALDYYLGLPTHEGVGAQFWSMGPGRDHRARPVAELIAQLAGEQAAGQTQPYWLIAMEGTATIIRKHGDLRAYLTSQGVPFVEKSADDLPDWSRAPKNTPVRLLVLYPRSTGSDEDR